MPNNNIHTPLDRQYSALRMHRHQRHFLMCGLDLSEVIPILNLICHMSDVRVVYHPITYTCDACVPLYLKEQSI